MSIRNRPHLPYRAFLRLSGLLLLLLALCGSLISTACAKAPAPTQSAAPVAVLGLAPDNLLLADFPVTLNLSASRVRHADSVKLTASIESALTENLTVNLSYASEASSLIKGTDFIAPDSIIILHGNTTSADYEVDIKQSAFSKSPNTLTISVKGLGSGSIPISVPITLEIDSSTTNFLPLAFKPHLPLFADGFDAAGLWDMRPEQGAEVMVEKGQMVVSHQVSARNVRVRAPKFDAMLGSFKIEVAAQQATLQAAEYGILLNYSEDTSGFPVYYRFLINPANQSYRLQKIVCTAVECQVETLSSASGLNSIKTGTASNLIRMEWEGKMLQAYVNDTPLFLQPVELGDYAGGRTGVMIFTAPSGVSAASPAKVYFDNFAIYSIP